MIMTELGAGNGFILSRRLSTNLLKISELYERSMMSRCKMPLSERAGRIEYLEIQVLNKEV
jgi:hypothetical protein